MVSRFLFSFFVLINSAYVFAQLPVLQPCESEIYCYGDLLHTVQMARLEKDSKSFVDMALKFPPREVLSNFNTFTTEHPTPTKEDVQVFVSANFENGTEFETFNPTDWKAAPDFLQGIADVNLRQFGKDLNDIWLQLGRKIKDDVRDKKDQYSMYYVTHPVIVPGGRFKEFYYWDSYWIQKGLIVSDMKDTVKGMIENFIEIVKILGFVPNGGRIYYQRTQPPLLTPMVKNYFDATGDEEFIKTNIGVLKDEFQYFMNTRMQDVRHNNKMYSMARYKVQRQGPRPESYREDYELADYLRKSLAGMGVNEETISKSVQDLYFNLKAGAESGWDYSSRWFVPMPNTHETGNLINVRTSEIIPVDLNGFLYWNAVLLKGFCDMIKDDAICDPEVYVVHATQLKTAINEVLWDEAAGSWFDYDTVRGERRNAFYPTNLVPLWVHAQADAAVVPKVLNYLRNSGALGYPGGIPTSLFQTGQQWDFPNGWAPLQHIVIEALEYSGNQDAKDLAFQLAQTWVQSNHVAFVREETMAEKYDVTVVGGQGGGGEYEVVLGFGWSNGVVLDFLKMYGDRLESLPGIVEPTTTPSSGTTTPRGTTTPSGTTTESGAETLFPQITAMTLILLSVLSYFV